MGCNSDYLDPNSREDESVRVCKNLAYLAKATGISIPSWAEKGAKNIYGAEKVSLDKQVAFLCKTLKKTPEDVIYNARNKDARSLADWWDEHQEADKKRIAKENEEKRLEKIRKNALKKLSDEEKDALGLD